MNAPAYLMSALLQAASVAQLSPNVIDALVQHESRWVPGVQGGRDKQCIGLGQICLHTFRACQGEHGGFVFDAPACSAVRVRLLDGVSNLHTIGVYLSKSRDYCMKRTGRADAAAVLSQYGGFDRKGLVCGQRRVDGHWVAFTHPEVRRILGMVVR